MKMFSVKQISLIQKINLLLPGMAHKKATAVICRHCYFVNENEFSFCTNCGYPLHNKQLVEAFNDRIEQRTNLLFKAETSVMVARIVLYIMASFLSMGIFFYF